MFVTPSGSSPGIPGSPRLVIVTDTLARRLWPGQDALGKRIRVGFVRPNEPWSTVVGVVGEVKQLALSDETRPAIYMPLSQAPRSFLLRNLNFVVRTDGDPASAAAAIRRQIRTVDNDLPFDRVDTMRQVLSDSRPRSTQNSQNPQRFFSSAWSAVSALIVDSQLSSGSPLRSGSAKIITADARKKADVLAIARPRPMRGCCASTPMTYGASAPASRPAL